MNGCELPEEFYKIHKNSIDLQRIVPERTHLSEKKVQNPYNSDTIKMYSTIFMICLKWYKPGKKEVAECGTAKPFKRKLEFCS